MVVERRYPMWIYYFQETIIFLEARNMAEKPQITPVSVLLDTPLFTNTEHQHVNIGKKKTKQHGNTSL